MRRVFVSGGSGGIGAATCAALARVGISPIVGHRSNAYAAQDLAQACGGIAVCCDLLNPDAIDAACAQIEDLGDLVAIVLGASPPPTLGSFSKAAPEEIEAQWRTNVAGPYRLLQRLVRGSLQPRRTGSVVGVLSAAMGQNGRPPSRGMGPYIVAKHGLAGLLSVLAAEYGWLRVRSVSPGYVRTKMLDAFDPRFIEAQEQNSGVADPDDVAALIVKELAL